jgi:colicin import membrane protein
MTARTANAFFLSAMIHALFAAALLYTAYSLKDEVIDKAKIFELVAGEGDNYAATAAPALGTPEGQGVEIKMPPGPPMPAPTITPPTPDPIVAAPEPAPVEAVPPPKVQPKPIAKPEPSPVVKATDAKPTPKADTPPNPSKTFNRKLTAITNKQKAQREKEAKAAALAAKNAEIAAKKAALLAESKAAGSGQTKVAKIDAEGIAAGVLGGSTANKTGGAGGTALSREEQDQLGTYFALLKQHLREAHEKPSGLSDLLAAKAEFYVAADGSISKVSIVQSSGNAEFDQSVLAAIRNVRTIGPRPDGKGDFQRVGFKMKDE